MILLPILMALPHQRPPIGRLSLPLLKSQILLTWDLQLPPQQPLPLSSRPPPTGETRVVVLRLQGLLSVVILLLLDPNNPLMFLLLHRTPVRAHLPPGTWSKVHSFLSQPRETEPRLPSTPRWWP